jgi:predicted phosphodiesterase
MRALLVGDTHGNARWWESFVVPTADASGADVIVQLGDFGFWGDTRFVRTVAECHLPVYFVDGNHENHPLLQEMLQGADLSAAVCISGSLHHLPRASVTEWDGVRLLALGGAASIDRSLRTPGVDWFEGELVSPGELERAQAAQASIVLAHDVPQASDVPLLPRDSLPHSWQRELPNCEAQRERLESVLDDVAPELWVHGHYHVSYERVAKGCRFVGLACDGHGSSSVRVLDLAGGEWRISAV